MGSLTLETSDQRRHRVDTTPRNHPDLTSVTHGRDRICCHTAENQHFIPSWSGALFSNSIKRFGVRVFHPIVCASSCRRGIKPSIPSGRRSRCCFRPGKSKGRKWSMAHLFPVFLPLTPFPPASCLSPTKWAFKVLYLSPCQH